MLQSGVLGSCVSEFLISLVLQRNNLPGLRLRWSFAVHQLPELTSEQRWLTKKVTEKETEWRDNPNLDPDPNSSESKIEQREVFQMSGKRQ